MLTARQIIEEYEAAKTVGKNYVEIFSNPTKSELDSFNGEHLRFIADATTKKVYVADAVIAIHYDIKKILRLKVPPSSTKIIYEIKSEPGCSDWLEGMAWRHGDGMYKMLNSDQLFGLQDYSEEGSEKVPAELAKKVLSELLEKDWSWVDKYIKVTSWLKRWDE